MNKKISTIFLLVSLFCISCQSTFTELGKKPPEKYVEVIPDDPKANVREQLDAAGVDHICKELYFGNGSSKNRKACFVKAPPASMYEKLEVKVSNLPSAILQDTGRNIVLTGELAMIWITGRFYIP
ncbi:MAG: hypothetical protein B0W54_03125 [Cellvibrio sp. 79]|nr:MAG: hypothetical protein B0W54_03125 [Cellvibrio sp. 79]